MRLLRFRKLTDGRIRLLILLDTSKGETDEAWLYALTWAAKPDGVTVAAYRDQIKAESKLPPSKQAPAASYSTTVTAN
jgi:hypothetical protein